MTNKIEFNMNIDKALESILYVLRLNENRLNVTYEALDIYFISRILYFGDFYHINIHGRPIIGDKYFSTPFGPIPYVSFKIMNFDSEIVDSIKEKIPFTVFCNLSQNNIIRKRDINEDVLSKTDMESLKHVYEVYSSYDFKHPTNSPAYLGWLYGFSKDFIDYEDLIYPQNKEIKEHLLEFSRVMIL